MTLLRFVHGIYNNKILMPLEEGSPLKGKES